MQLSRREIRTSEPLRLGQAEEASCVETLDGLLGNATLLLSRSLVLAQPGTHLPEAGDDLLS